MSGVLAPPAVECGAVLGAHIVGAKTGEPLGGFFDAPFITF
jgi:hypothetical protein